MPGLSLVDLGQCERDLSSPTIKSVKHCEIKDPKLDPKEYEVNLLKLYKNREEHCFFFNAAEALFSDAKRYKDLRQILFLIYSIIARLPDDHPFLDSSSSAFTQKYDWFGELNYQSTRRLIQFYFYRNENLDEDYLETSKVRRLLQKKLNVLCQAVFGVETKSLSEFLESLSEGTARTKKSLYRKLAKAYLCSNFQGDGSDCKFLGRLFAVQFSIHSVKEERAVKDTMDHWCKIL